MHEYDELIVGDLWGCGGEEQPSGVEFQKIAEQQFQVVSWDT